MSEDLPLISLVGLPRLYHCITDQAVPGNRGAISPVWKYKGYLRFQQVNSFLAEWKHLNSLC